MLLYFVTCISFLLFLKPLIPLKPLPSWASSEVRLISLLSCEQFSCLRSILHFIFLCKIFKNMSVVKKTMTTSKVEHVDEDKIMGEGGNMVSVLDLPDLVLETILERLNPESLCQMGGVCRALRERCVSDHLWERHMRQKWGRVIGPVAYREWKWHVASSKRNGAAVGGIRHGGMRQRGFMRLVSSLHWPPFSWMMMMRSRVVDDSTSSCSSSGFKQRSFTSPSPSPLPADSIMTWYLALETGNFWFPAQVYNRENGHVGFMLSCYDAELSYDPRTDTFQARYPPHGRRAVAVEPGIQWERLRAPPVDTPPHDLHISDCLNDLHPGDNIEIQWRRNKEFPYGWWYGVVGHLESCDGNENYCRCHNSDTVVLEFNQYTPDSRWRRTTVSRKDHREEGNEADGFYGGIRKIKSEREISTWKNLWPSEVLD